MHGSISAPVFLKALAGLFNLSDTPAESIGHSWSVVLQYRLLHDTLIKPNLV